MDSLHLLAVVSNLQAQDSSETLQNIAEKQESQLKNKKEIRNVQEVYDQYMKDGKMEFNELENLHQLRTEIGICDESFWNEDGRVREFTTGMWSVDASAENAHGHGHNDVFYLDTTDGSNATQRTNKSALDAIGSSIKSKMDDATDNEAMLQFQIQIATSDMQNSESNRSQAEKKLSDHRNELRRNWGA